MSFTSGSRWWRPSLVLVLLSCAVAALRASGPVFWVVGTPAELMKGTSDGVYISLEGGVTAGPRLTNRLTSTPPQVWALALGSDDSIWAGTGGDGRVLHLRAGQPEQTVFDADESGVFALAVAGTKVYAATSPDGRVYVIDGASPAKPFFDPAEKYIWALAVDRGGNLWVGAGSPAVVYKVDAAGKDTVVYKPPAAHVVSLVPDASGRMLAGTESPGRLYRFDAADHPFVLVDSGLTEMHAISTGPDGAIFAAAVSSGTASPPESGETAAVSAAAPPSPPAGGATPAAAPNRRSVVYRIDANGSWEPLWETDDVVYDLAAMDDGGVLAATGPDGRLYKVEADRRVLLYSGVDARQITRVLAPRDRNVAAIATANPGRVVRLGPSEQSPATYVSPVRDTKGPSVWGAISWESMGQVELFTRSGNTSTPDDSWSDWAGPYVGKIGEAIKSPAGRFLQWRAVFTHPPAPPLPTLTSVTVSYLPRNARPSVDAITVHPPGVVFQRPFSSDDAAVAGLDDAVAAARRPPGAEAGPTPPLGRRWYQKGLQTLAWKAADDDGDQLTYSLFYRREGESDWHPLRSDLADEIYVWDVTSVPDGRYTVKVVASDAIANSPDRALTGEKESDPIDVDNTPPVISADIVGQGGPAHLVIKVHDAQSAIRRVEVSRADGSWNIVYPVDGLADSRDEQYDVPLDAASAARIVVRATDVLLNVASVVVR